MNTIGLREEGGPENPEWGRTGAINGDVNFSKNVHFAPLVYFDVTPQFSHDFAPAV